VSRERQYFLTLMRHFLAVAALAIRVVETALAAALVPATRLAYRLSPSLSAAGARAIAVAVIAKRAEKKQLQALLAVADDESK
jgi:hypothetical protein